MGVLPLLRPNWQQGGGGNVEILTNFLMSVAAGILCYYICKWLDRHNKGQ
jgi:ABC-type multidrug transport system permease subunit